MRLSIRRLLRSSTSRTALRAADAYAVAGITPALAFDFVDEYYRTNGSQTDFDSAITHSRDSLATMVDAEGLLKWAPHNLALNSATPATQSIAVISGADYTIECTGVSIALSGAGTGTVTEGSPVTITASTTTLTLTVTGSTGTMWAYRSDLGGMVNNPDTGNSYVPTTDSAVYLPRRGHHVYNGSEWVNEGILHESEARTNYVLNSGDFSGDNWVLAGSGNPTLSIVDGEQRVSWTNGPGNILDNEVGFTPSAGETFTLSFRVKVIDLGGADLSNFEINLEDGTRTEVTEKQITLVDNGEYAVYHVTHTFSAPSGIGMYIHFRYTSDNSPVLAFEYAQLEQGPTPSSYIPTSGSTVTRSADTLTVDAVDLPWPEPTALSARNDLINNAGWVITDGGAA